MTMKKTPIIGITLDSEEPGGYSKFPWYAVRENYCSWIAKAGGLPVVLPHEVDKVADYLDLIDGLLITGGNFDVDPTLFGAETRHATVKTKDRRTRFEMALTEEMLKRDRAVLGICGGQQLLHVMLGGTLIQHIPDEIEGALAHEQPNPRDEAGHTVEIVPGSFLHHIVGTLTLEVNSAHHQAAFDEAPPKSIVNARSSDGVVEGIEDPAKRFCLGVQWHPEFSISEGDDKIARAFVRAARES